jgi:hypothetical protein
MGLWDLREPRTEEEAKATVIHGGTVSEQLDEARDSLRIVRQRLRRNKDAGRKMDTADVESATRLEARIIALVWDTHTHTHTHTQRDTHTRTHAHTHTHIRVLFKGKEGCWE